MDNEHVPDISVIVVVYNDAPHLANAVESVLAQAGVSLEVIISDDHSTDATPEVAAALAGSDPRVTYHRRDENAGAPGAPLNDGLDRARGDYIMFLGSDDALVPGACAALLTKARATNADLVSAQLVRVLLAEDSRRQPWFPELHATDRFVDALEAYPQLVHDTLTTNKLYRHSFLERIDARFPQGIFYEDVVFSAETLAQARGIALIPDEVYEWKVYPRDERESITNQRHTRRNLEDRLQSLVLAEQAFAGSGEAVQREFAGKVLTHHLRFYLNDLREADDAWGEWVLETIRPRLEMTPLDAYRRGFLGDRALYAAALEGDVAAVRDVLRGKAGGALAGRIYTAGDETFWAPRDRDSRPSGTPLARAISDISDRAPKLKPHAAFDYLYLLTEVQPANGVMRLSGIATDPLGVLADPRSSASLRIATDSGSVDLSVPVVATPTPEGVSWHAEAPLPEQLAPHDGEPRMLTLSAVAADGSENVGPVQSELPAETSVPDADAGKSSVWALVAEPRAAARFVFTGAIEPSPKRVVVIGDVSWRGRYHLGDEAMTEAAIAQLQARGLEVTLVAGDPELSGAFYGVPAVPVFGFATCRTSQARDERAHALQQAALGRATAAERDAQTIAAVKSADAVVIAGGGNINSSGVHHIYERLMLKRIAEQAGVPLYVTSQTVGPHLLPEHRELVREIAQYATVFGARERATTALLRELCDGLGTIVQTVDDAMLLDASEDRAELPGRFDLPAAYAVGSFTYHAFSTGLSREEYYRELASMLDDVVATNDIEVVLVPHMGVLGVEAQEGVDNDQFGHERIVSYTTSGRVRSLPLISARELFSVTADAAFTISSRYHPVVFGAALGVPAIGVVTSFYSALRMRGALAHVGMESFAIPFEHWSLFGRRVLGVLSERRDAFAAHSRAAGERQRSYQNRWWDGIAGSISGTGDVLRVDVAPTDAFEWTDERNAELLAVAQVAQEGTNMYRMNNLFTVERHAKQLKELEREARDARSEADALRRELAEVRALLAEVRHRLRPPGAALRDRVRGKLRRMRDR